MDRQDEKGDVMNGHLFGATYHRMLESGLPCKQDNSYVNAHINSMDIIL